MFSKRNILRFPLFLLCLALPAFSHSAVLVKAKMWPKNSVLNIVFIDGTAEQREQVKRIAPSWIENSSLSFVFYDSFQQAPKQTQVRISFRSDIGSVLGDHGDYYSHDATLLLGELNDPETPTDRARRLILHEFGHVLGFEHEYRNPKWPYGPEAINQQVEACYPRMQALQFSLEEAKRRCLENNRPLQSTITNATVFDEYSIMNYPLSIQLQYDQIKTISAKYQLSILDLLAIQRWYGE